MSYAEEFDKYCMIQKQIEGLKVQWTPEDFKLHGDEFNKEPRMNYIESDFINEREWDRYNSNRASGQCFKMKKGFNPKDVQDREEKVIQLSDGQVLMQSQQEHVKNHFTKEELHGEMGEIHKYIVDFDKKREAKKLEDKESKIYNILIKSITHISTVEQVQRQTKAIMEIFNA